MLTEDERKARHREAARKYRVANPDKVRATKRKYRDVNLERIRERSRSWMGENREWVRAYYKQKRIENPAKARAGYVAAKANRRGKSDGTMTSSFISLIKNIKICNYCLSPITGATHVEHIIPLSRGGLHSVHNITASCGPCNLKKHTSLWPVEVFPHILSWISASMC